MSLEKSYETVIVFSPDINEGALKEEIKKVESCISSNGGSELATASWGRKEIAYKSGAHKFGNYVAFNFKGQNPELIDGLTRTLRITDSILKFQTHRTSDAKRKFQGNPNRKPSMDSGDDYGADLDY